MDTSTRHPFQFSRPWGAIEEWRRMNLISSNDLTFIIFDINNWEVYKALWEITGVKDVLEFKESCQKDKM